MKSLIYVSGASGFVGKHLVDSLVERYEVIAVPHDALDTFKYTDFHTYFYLASYGNHYQQKDITMTYKANVHRLWTTMLRLRDLQFKNFIHISTSSITIDEQTMYSATKQAGELLVREMAYQYRKRMFSVRPYSLFGEGEADFRFIPMMVHKLMKNEKPLLVTQPTHDWVYVEDFVYALIYLMHQDMPVKEPIGVGYGLPRTNLEVFKDICALLGKEPAYKRIGAMRSYDSPNWYKKEHDMLEETGWAPIYGYKEGLKRTVKYYAQ